MEEQAILSLNEIGVTPGVIRTPDPLPRRPGELGYLVDSAARLATEAAGYFVAEWPLAYLPPPFGKSAPCHWALEREKIPRPANS